MPDIVRDLQDPESISTDVAALDPPCPSPVEYTGYQLWIKMVTEISTSLEIITISSYVQVVNFVEIRSSISDIAKVGTYEI